MLTLWQNRKLQELRLLFHPKMEASKERKRMTGRQQRLPLLFHMTLTAQSTQISWFPNGWSCRLNSTAWSQISSTALGRARKVAAALAICQMTLKPLNCSGRLLRSNVMSFSNAEKQSIYGSKSLMSLGRMLHSFGARWTERKSLRPMQKISQSPRLTKS